MAKKKPARKPRAARKPKAPPPPPPIGMSIFGGVRDLPAAALDNTALLNHSLQGLLPGETLVIPRGTYHVMGGVEGIGLSDVTIQIDGKLIFSPKTRQWPHYADGIVHKAGLAFWDARGLRLTSASGHGELNGNGRAWWSLPGIGYLIHQEQRPRLLTIANSSDVLVENLLLADSPYWTTLFLGVQSLEIRNCGVVARRTNDLSHSLIDLSAFNTDGFDVAGCRDVWVHDCDIWTQDDAIAVKDHVFMPRNASEQFPNATAERHAYLSGVRHGGSDGSDGHSSSSNEGSSSTGASAASSSLGIVVPSENMLFERINASGLGLTIGSIGDGVVRNVTFRDCYLRKTVKGPRHPLNDSLIPLRSPLRAHPPLPALWCLLSGTSSQVSTLSSTAAATPRAPSVV